MGQALGGSEQGRGLWGLQLWGHCQGMRGQGLGLRVSWCWIFGAEAGFEFGFRIWELDSGTGGKVGIEDLSLEFGAGVRVRYLT